MNQPNCDRHSERDRAKTPDWSTLIGQLADGFTRVFRAEIQLLEKRLSHSASETIGNAVTNAAAILILAATTIAGLICLLGGYILLLNRWLPAWQAWGIGGLTIIVIGAIIFVILNTRLRRRS
ncbi:MAG TPA: phage holin family protein [Candidatus Binataceae bacterium]|nr:phage holin family protein [Candidatus Binataceae bacterium]